jgi:hypothetical protein
MLAIRLAESAATGRRFTGWFQGLLGGNTGQRGAPGSGRARTIADSDRSVSEQQIAMSARRLIDQRS